MRTSSLLLSGSVPVLQCEQAAALADLHEADRLESCLAARSPYNRRFGFGLLYP
jgi:hypothetical protein